ncbi:MAG: amidophosphoribosyltransferase [Bacteroidia bacterium]|nr:amidophosphoribosyltransferase [Bacteroidia bacterium]MCX7651793.1 amidophosphoribosyltransferase [Bacteroidia bacterium]MDW8417105.1 amidophosphoribosyltransferase [Bacteroidia bacterium]
MCGIVWLRLLRPIEEYPSPVWGLQKVALLLQKQRNRGQDGAGLLTYKARVPSGKPYFYVKKLVRPAPPWKFLVEEIWAEWDAWQKTQASLYDFPYLGEGYLAHLRYGTFSGYGIEDTHPVLRLNSWPSRSLAIVGNFNLTNTQELFDRLTEMGQHPLHYSDTYTVLERMGHFLDEYVENSYQEAKVQGLSKSEASDYIRRTFPITDWLGRSARRWDGGYVIAGWLGNGWGFVMRDPLGIRPAYYLATEAALAVASEAAALHNVFEISPEKVQEIPPGHALVISPEGQWRLEPFTTPAPKPSRCSFERIYFSRGNSPHIYTERKTLGALLAHEVARVIDYNFERTIFTYIPNTSQTAFWGLLKELENILILRQFRQIQSQKLSEEELRALLHQRIRAEYLVWKDTQSRTFISSPELRREMSRHTYDVIYNIVQPGKDTLVCLDDSIVRGTTLRETLLRTLGHLRPARLIIASSAPQIRYPDFYGIDMASLHDLIAFQAAVALLKEQNMTEVIEHTYALCRRTYGTEEFSRNNYVKALYAPFTEAQIAAKVAELVRPAEIEVPLTIVYQPVENLTKALPNHRGDWYFTGNYPTPGGYRLVNLSFMQFYEGKLLHRSYERVSL